MIKIVCNHFGDPTFARLAAALKASVENNAPDTKFAEMVTAMPEARPGLIDHYTHNHEKLRVWRDAIHSEPDGSQVVLMDADTLVLGPLDDAFEKQYDIAWTWRPGRLPVNSGVVYVRCNERSRAFMDAWVCRDEQLMHHRTLADHGAHKYGGANQASFMWLITHGKGQDIAKIEDVMCRYWNSVDQTWCQFDDETRVLHIKGALRDACIGKPKSPFWQSMKMLSVNGVESDINLGKLAEVWRQYDNMEVAA